MQEQQVYPAVLEMQRVISHAYPESIRAGSLGYSEALAKVFGYLYHATVKERKIGVNITLF